MGKIAREIMETLKDHIKSSKEWPDQESFYMAQRLFWRLHHAAEKEDMEQEAKDTYGYGDR
jgi:hypothetical protein